MGHDVCSIGSPLGDPQQSSHKNIPWTSLFWMANVHLEFGAEVSEKLPYYDANAAPDALWGQPSANGCRNQATRLPTGAWHWWHGDKVAKTSCPACAALDIDATCAPRRPRIQATPHEHARRTTRGFAPAQHIRSATAPERRRRARGPSPAPTARADRKRKNERTTEDTHV